MKQKEGRRDARRVGRLTYKTDSSSGKLGSSGRFEKGRQPKRRTIGGRAEIIIRLSSLKKTIGGTYRKAARTGKAGGNELGTE